MMAFATMALLAVVANGEPTANVATEALVWTPQTVLFPLATEASTLARRRLAIAGTHGTEPTVRGPVTLQKGDALGVVLEPLELLRVRVLGDSPTPADLRFGVIRYASDGHSVASTDNAGLPVDHKSVFLVAPPGGANLWIVKAVEPVVVLVERPFLRAGGLGWEPIRDALQDHCLRGRQRPELPSFGGMPAVNQTLDRVRTVTQALRSLANPVDPQKREAVEGALAAYCLGTVEQAFDLAVPHRTPVFRHNTYDRQLAKWPTEPSFAPGVDDDEPLANEQQGAMEFSMPLGRTWHRMDEPATRVDLQVEGPAVLVVEMRGLWPIVADRAGTIGQALSPRQLRLTVDTGTESISERRTLGPALVETFSPALRAYPQRNLLLTQAGEPTSYKAFLRFSIPPGQRRLTIRLTGGPALFRIATAHRQPRLHEALAGSWVAAVQQADAALLATRGGRSIAALAIHESLSTILGKPETLTPAQRMALPPAFHRIPPSPSTPTLGDTITQDTRLAAAETAWRMAPLDENSKRLHRDLWREGTRWRTLSPGSTDKDAAPPASPLHFIETRLEPKNELTVTARNLLWPVQTGFDTVISVPASPKFPTRTGLLRLYIRRGNSIPGPIEIQIGAFRSSLVALLPVEVLEMGLAPGRHPIRIDAPSGTQIVSSFPVSDPGISTTEPAASPFVRSLWPAVNNGEPTKIPIPNASTAGPVRLQFRAFHPNAETRHLTMHTNVGATRSFTVNLDEADPNWIAIGNSTTPTLPAEIVVYLPATTSQIWFTGTGAEDVSVVAAIRVQYETGSETLATKTAVAPSETNTSQTTPTTVAEQLQRVHQTSSSLAANANDASLLMNRIEALLDANDGNQARYDLLRLLEKPESTSNAAQTVRRSALVELFDEWLEPTHLRHSSETEGVFAIRPVALSHPEWGRDPQVEKLAETVRSRGLEKALQYLETARLPEAARHYFLGRLYEHLGRHNEATLSFLKVDPEGKNWQASFQAMGPLVAALTAHPSDEALAVLGYAAASAIEARIGHPLLARALAATARLTRWLPLRRVEQAAGFERLFSTRKLPDLTPNAKMRWALSGAPWPVSESHVLRPGRGAAIDLRLKHAATLSVQAWCVRWRSQQLEPVTCPVRYQVNNTTAQTATLKAGVVVKVMTQTVQAGQHRIEVTHTGPDDDTLLVVRFSDGGSIPVSFPARWFTVHGDAEPAELAILGPAVVRIEARRHGDATPADLRMLTEHNGQLSEQVLTLSTTVDVAATSDRNDPVVVTLPTEKSLILSSPGLYRIAFKTDAGSAAIRLFLRSGRAHAFVAALPARVSEVPHEEEEGYSLAAQPYVQAGLVSPTPAPWWATLSLGLHVGQESFVERDTPTVTPSGLVAVNLDWRRRFLPRRAWIGAGLTLRWNDQDWIATDQSPPGALSTGTHVRSDIRNLPLGIGIQTSARLMIQLPTGNSPTASAAQGQIGLNRLITTGLNTGLLPSLSLLTNHMGYRPPTPGVPDILGNVPPPLTVDPLVYNAYDDNHPLALQANLTGIWFAFQDQLAMFGLRATANPDFATLDNLQAQLVWRGLAPNPEPLRTNGWAPTLFQLRYRPSLRFADEDRAATTVRHDLGASVILSRWRGSTGRGLLELRDDLALSLDGRTRNTLLISFRFDFTPGRALLDLFPTEDDFSTLLSNAPWGDLP
jgi:hypothetical protein